MPTIPMFPLGSVLLPGAVLPLHVFEPRYRELVAHCLSNEPEFGVVLIERGREVGGGEVRTTLGTVARIVQLAQLPGDRYAMTCVGTRRIRVETWLDDDPYPKAEIEEWPDELDDVGEGELEATIAALEPVVRRAAALAVELGDTSASTTDEIATAPVLASYHLSQLAPLGPADRQALLAAPGPARRLELLAELVADAQLSLHARLSDS